MGSHQRCGEHDGVLMTASRPKLCRLRNWAAAWASRPSIAILESRLRRNLHNYGWTAGAARSCISDRSPYC
jgi:hypothetical protein